MSKLEPLPDADDALFRKCFDETVRSLHLPSKRKGEGYGSAFVQSGFELAFGTVNRMRNHQIAEAKKAEQNGKQEHNPTDEGATSSEPA